DVYMATLGKAVGTFGAFVAGSDELIEYLQSRARTFCFTTATPPILAAATLAALDLIETETWRRERLAAHVFRLRAALLEQGWQLTESQTAIQPIIIGSAEKTLALSKKLELEGILAVAIRPPTVPVGTSRLRVTLSAAHSDEDVERLIEVLSKHRCGSD
ncbi:MAG: aminotransferase class I/II-fold pyridoxal phosphate-dependent enzyme, partial [Candidatus Saccharibacteria bacterium]|nr:aminotransferase class I/II-fold pyridoxal phosphate-dependent enzyme [Moraxellaceae bacterium]